MELRQARYFLVVAEERSFTAASERLHIAQSAVSQQIRRLERELGVDLFDRSHRRIELTDAGRRCLPEIRSLIDAERAVQRRARDIPVDRRLRFGTSSGLGEELRTAMREVDEGFGVTVDLIRVPTAERARRILDGTLDAAVVRLSPNDVVPAGLVQTPLEPSELVIVVGLDHPLAQVERFDLGMLEGMPLRLIGRDVESSFFTAISDACVAAGFVPTLDDIAAGTEQDLFASLATGRRIWTAYHRARIPTIDIGSLRFLTVENDPPIVDTSVLWRANDTDPVLACFLSSIRR